MWHSAPSVATSELSCSSLHRVLHSFPTRRSSDLSAARFLRAQLAKELPLRVTPELRFELDRGVEHAQRIDRKSTRLNSSHVEISYAVFCLKKKTDHHLHGARGGGRGGRRARGARR